MVSTGNNRPRPELRKQSRRLFHYNTRIVTDQKTPPITCSITDISEIGARLVIEAKAEVPDTFILLLTANGEARRQCRVVWRDGTDIGVEFPHGRS
jgi:hypothetical protein